MLKRLAQNQLQPGGTGHWPTLDDVVHHRLRAAHAQLRVLVHHAVQQVLHGAVLGGQSGRR